MLTDFKVGNKVKYVLGEAPEYLIVATKEEPRKRKFMTPVTVKDGYDYVIVSLPLSEEVSPFIDAVESHLELISEN
jgi:hypothetical protein